MVNEERPNYAWWLAGSSHRPWTRFQKSPSGGADQSVDDSGQCRHVAEGQAEQRGHEIEPRDGNESPVQRPDHDEHCRTNIDSFHL
jgi:hypothetical protein